MVSYGGLSAFRARIKRWFRLEQRSTQLGGRRGWLDSCSVLYEPVQQGLADGRFEVQWVTPICRVPYFRSNRFTPVGRGGVGHVGDGDARPFDGG